MSFRRFAITLALSLSCGAAQAALIEMFDTDLTGTALDSLAEAEAIIAASGGPDFVTNSNIINFSGDSFPGADFGSPPDDRFVMRVTGLIDTDAYDQLFVNHDDGFMIRIGGIDFFAFDGNTPPRVSASGVLGDSGMQTFEMIYWDAGDFQVARLGADVLFDRFVIVTDSASGVPEPGTLLLLGIGLVVMTTRRRKTV